MAVELHSLRSKHVSEMRIRWHIVGPCVPHIEAHWKYSKIGLSWTVDVRYAGWKRCIVIHSEMWHIWRRECRWMNAYFMTLDHASKSAERGCAEEENDARDAMACCIQRLPCWRRPHLCSCMRCELICMWISMKGMSRMPEHMEKILHHFSRTWKIQETCSYGICTTWSLVIWWFTCLQVLTFSSYSWKSGYWGVHYLH